MLKKDQVGKAKTEKVAPKPGQKRKAYPCSTVTLELAPKKAKAKPREVGKAPLKRDKAAGAPLAASGGQKVKHSGSRQGRYVNGWQDREFPAATGVGWEGLSSLGSGP